MNTQQAYNLWASQYDTNKNKTRDLEAAALRNTLKEIPFQKCLEVGCGTGKNSVWLSDKAMQLTVVDFSEGMLNKAREKVANKKNVVFRQADITTQWHWTSEIFDLVSFSLVLEHTNDLYHVFAEASRVLAGGGYVYVGELHPFKQYDGTKARFDVEGDRHVLKCFDHHISDFFHAAKRNDLELVSLDEYFDEDDRNRVPRIIALLFKKEAPSPVSYH